MNEITEEVWKRACRNMAQASEETVELFGALLQNIVYDPVKQPVKHAECLASIVNYVASVKFLEEEGV